MPAAADPPWASDVRLTSLKPVDRAEVTIVMDNFVDVLMAGSEDVQRYRAYDLSDRKQLVAEHGFSALITVESDGRRSSALYDGGLTPGGLARNLDVLGVPVKDLRGAVVPGPTELDHRPGPRVDASVTRCPCVSPGCSWTTPCSYRARSSA